MTRVVAAAGGVVWRRNDAGREVQLVHRPRYDDWSLPKGKVEPGEHPLCAAVREVGEETGVLAVPQLRLPTIGYLTGEPDVEKRVDFWAMRAVHDSGRAPDDEVREARWVPEGEAGRLASYRHDREVLAAFSALPPVDMELALVRHARAGVRAPGVDATTDAARPLDTVGRRDALALCGLLGLLRPDRVVSATPIRCQDTVRPLGLPLSVDPAFDEASPGGVPGALKALRELAERPTPTVVCSQGGIIPAMLAGLRPDGGYQTDKGTGWLLAFAAGRLVGIDRLAAL